ncbi:MAG: hypothetical protein H6523_13110 [Mycolicibacterium sp.]|nr:hypothetical protein [Mycolicibacterium sp.]
MSDQPEELTEVERVQRAAARSAISDFRTAMASGDEDERHAAAGAFLQSMQQLNPDETRDKIHVPEDAGEFRDSLISIMCRIPDGWGRWIGCRAGWYRIITELDAALAELDPDYGVRQCKQKFGGLRFYFDTELDDDVRTQMRALVAAAEELSAITCEFCGQPGTLHINRYGGVVTACSACGVAEGFGRLGETVDELTPMAFGVWKVSAGDVECWIDLNYSIFEDDKDLWTIQRVDLWPRVGESFRLVVTPYRYERDREGDDPGPESVRESGAVTRIERVR